MRTEIHQCTSDFFVMCFTGVPIEKTELLKEEEREKGVVTHVWCEAHEWGGGERCGSMGKCSSDRVPAFYWLSTKTSHVCEDTDYGSYWSIQTWASKHSRVTDYPEYAACTFILT